MFWCKVNHFLLAIFPFGSWQNYIIRSHIQDCEGCRKQLASREEVKDFFILESEVEGYRDFWPAIKSEIAEKPREKKAKYPLNRRWAFAAASLAVVILTGFVFLLTLSQNGALLDQEGQARFQINSIRVGDEPATPFVYQPKDSDMILVWAEKNL
jgi:predicted anti-sigma-YlaC factor YlaD